ncbi:hypothetical protein ACQZV8_14610 [Magnetococcales bacterium HHB-1]
MIIGMAFMIYSSIFIQQHLGRIEMHFHVWIAMAFLIRYKDITKILAVTITIAVHHLSFNHLQAFKISTLDTPFVVFNYGHGLDIVILHAAWIIFAACV